MGGFQSICNSDQTVQSTQLPPSVNMSYHFNTPYQSQISRSKIKPNQNCASKSNQSISISQEELLPQKQYIDKLPIKDNVKRQIYRTFTDFQIINQLNHREISISKGAKLLNHKKIPLIIEQFLKFDWKYVQKIDFTKCLIHDSQWKLFVSKASLFPNLKILRLDQNQISTVGQGDLEAFLSLRNVSFGDYDSIANPLSKESKKYLSQFERSHASPKFWLEYVPQ